MAKQDGEWIGLSEAAELLGVHPTTVRAWADKGEIPSRRTPGGHRRFRRRDLIQREADSAAEPAEAQVMMQSALGRTRIEVGDGNLNEFPWYKQFNDEARQFHRTMGRKLLTLLTHYLTVAETRSSDIAEAQQLGREYAELSREQGLDLTGTVQAFLFFRDVLADSVIQLSATMGIRTANEWGEKLRAVNYFTDTILVAMIGRYEDLSD